MSLNSGAVSSGSSWGAGGGGGHGRSSTSVPGQQRAAGTGCQRRATSSNPSGMDTVLEHVAEAADAADDQGPDQTLRAGGTRRRDRRPPGRTQASPGRQAAPQSPGASSVPLSTMLVSSSKVYGASSISSNIPVSLSGYAQWRQRMKLPEGQRVFCISGTGNHSHGIRAGLVARGWYENPEHNSPFFDYKWSSNPLDIAHEQLWPGQTVNHFKNAQCLTTKHGLCHTVREMVWWEAADAATFYPRAYDISDEANRREFLQDVRWTAAESLIKRALLDGMVASEHVPYTGPPKKSGQSISSSKHAAPGTGSSGHGGGGSIAAVPGGGAAVAPGQAGATEAEGTAGAGTEDEGGSEQSGRLQQRNGMEPLVDLPSLRLACRVIAARLRQQRHLRVVNAAGATATGGGTNAGGGSDGAAPAELDLSPAQWQQLVRHRALFCSAPLIPPPGFDPNWISGRRFITSIHLPRPGASGSGSRKARRDGKSPRRKHGKPRGRSPRAEGDGAAARQPDGNEGERGPEGAAATAGGASDPPSRGGGADGGGATSSSSTDAEDGPEAGKDEADGTMSGRGRCFTKVAVADAAELLRKAAAAGRTRRRRHSAPASGCAAGDGGGGGGDGSDREAACGKGMAAGADGDGEGEGADCSRSGSDHGDVGGDALGAAEDDLPDPSWLPSDLPAICYDDEALQALDHGNWREAAAAVLSALSATVVQTHISGTNNIWIVKPAGKSRGRGIRLFNDPDVLLQYTRGEEAQGLEARWVAQKYVERPLIIWRRKFDIRQWVLVTDWNPLCVWFYSTCYLRFAATDYDPNNLDIFQHLTNNSVAKYYEGPVKEDEITANGNMWSIPRFEAWLEETYGRADLWPSLLQPAMKHVVICTLKCAQDLIAARKGSCQLYGYDFLIDDQLRVWLLEINSSPTLEASTPITTQLCADVQEDILRVTVDLPDHLVATAAAAKRRTAAPTGTAAPEVAAASDAPGGVGGFDTGKWECIVDGGEEMKRPDYTGLNLELKGTAIPVPSPARAASSSNLVGRLYAATRQGQSQQAQGQGDKQQSTASPGKGPDRTMLRQASPPGQPYQPHIPPPPQHQHHHHRNNNIASGHTHGVAEEETGPHGSAYAASAAAAVRVYAAGVTGLALVPAGLRAASRASPMRLRTPRPSSNNISASAAAAAAAPPAAVGVVGRLTAPQLSTTRDSAAAGALVQEFTALGSGNLLASLPPPAVAMPGTPQRLMTPRGDMTLAASALAAGAAAVLGINGGTVPGAGAGGGMEPLSPMAARASLFLRPGMRS
ncbi:hypothetical protein HYH02_000599 [Chlamydomonas schloesseri]|uniref:Uncharacterized protein n=1 Tax=Chlamydomonas schloesseri TaxID=2026947 RepID=A0A836BDH6_9CHLO|nr:hypothetical protein HYH02_000599 [Chlamydomonas schloesseri]|eukprot:KAG2454764.1 hypothetical protein HYH02_000599 [Chlamydomonas schloesseri]